MALLPEYKSFEEKDKFFFQGGDGLIGNVESIFTILEQNPKGVDIFRGCPEAKYKLFNSAQRFYITNELHFQTTDEKRVKHYSRFIEGLINECKRWNENTVEKLMVSNGINPDDALAYLSYMQHYSIPSPLLDFTTNPYKALFFAIDNVRYQPSNNLIDNYFSLYVCWSNHPVLSHLNETFTKMTDSFGNVGIPYVDLSKTLIYLVHTETPAYRIVNNANIINQEGMFFYNSHPFYPLEEVYKDIPNTVFIDGKKKNIKSIDSTLARCYNIHKSLIPLIREKLKEKGITKELLFPDVYKMQEAIIDKATINVLWRGNNVRFKDL